MRKLMLTVAASAMLATGAFAADVSTIPATYESSGFDWEGFYAGVFGGAYDFPAAYVGGAAGYNFALTDNIIGGVEVSGMLYVDGSGDTELFATSRLGFAPDDSILLYGVAGFGTYNFGNTSLYTIGAGVEFAATDNLSLRGEIRLTDVIGSIPPTVFSGNVGAFWHFN